MSFIGSSNDSGQARGQEKTVATSGAVSVRISNCSSTRARSSLSAGASPTAACRSASRPSTSWVSTSSATATRLSLEGK